jgi:hypothetical protein
MAMIWFHLPAIILGDDVQPLIYDKFVIVLDYLYNNKLY